MAPGCRQKPNPNYTANTIQMHMYSNSIQLKLVLSAFLHMIQSLERAFRWLGMDVNAFVEVTYGVNIAIELF